ncbi:hypothetical protein CLAIMM_07244 [Cladophialophora immunda]|nr:hypothetical protein CLAIMM_07244 [Cladophialophora immunda]
MRPPPLRDFLFVSRYRELQTYPQDLFSELHIKSECLRPERILNATSKSQPPSIPVLGGPASQFIKELPPELARKQWYAQKLYEAGQTAIYRPPSHFGIYAASFVMGSSSLAIAGLLAYGNIWAWEGDSELPWFVPVAHRLGIFVFSAVGWLIMMRSLRFIKAIDLVPVNGIVKLAVQRNLFSSRTMQKFRLQQTKPREDSPQVLVEPSAKQSIIRLHQREG